MHVKRSAHPAATLIPRPTPGEHSDIPRSPVGAVQRVLANPDLLWVDVQPIVDLERGVFAGYECLARCPKEWSVAPDVLFAAATMVGVAGRLQRHILSHTLALRESAPANSFLTVNIEPGDLLDPAVISTLLEGGDLRGIVVEVTERGWPQAPERMVKSLDQLRSAGALVALDDAGTGHSDLERLMTLRPDIVKLDHHLVSELETDAVARSMVTLMGELCSQMDAWLLVEGIERTEQLQILCQLGVPLGQGYLLGQPQSPWPEPELSLDQRAVVEQGRMRDCLVVVLEPPQDRGRLGSVVPGDQMAMAPLTPLDQALRRALNRPPDYRFDPIAVTDSTGAMIGEVAIDRLMLAALERAQGQPSTSST